MNKDKVKVLPCTKITREQDQLTTEQEAYAHYFAQERIAALLSTDASDEQEAEVHLREVYQVAGLPPPHAIRWFDSPISFVKAYAEGSVGVRVEPIVRDMVAARVGTRVKAGIGDTIWNSVSISVGDSVYTGVWSLWDSVGDSVGDKLTDSVGDSVTAYYNASLFAFYQFFHDVFEENDLIHLALFNEMVSGYRLGSEEAWLVRKPIVPHTPQTHPTHGATGMCLSYRDGWGFYAWHGVRCSEQIILQPETLTREDWMRERNVEVRRVIQERMGHRFVTTIGGKLLHAGQRASLYEVDITVKSQLPLASNAHYNYQNRLPSTEQTNQGKTTITSNPNAD